MSVAGTRTTKVQRRRPSTPAFDDALVEFCRVQHPRLVGMLGLYCGDGDLAEELAQESLVRLCREWDQLPGADDAVRWVNRVAFNLAKSTFRTRAARRRITERFGAALAPHSYANDDDASLAVRSAVALLPQRQRRVVILRYFCDLSVRDVALQMNCQEGTVKSLTSLAITRLRSSGLEFSDG